MGFQVGFWDYMTFAALVILAGTVERIWRSSDNGRSWSEVNEAWTDMRPFSTGGTYINFLTEDEGPERIGAAIGKGLQKLAEVKTRWDPENVFRTNRNIIPA